MGETSKPHTMGLAVAGARQKLKDTCDMCSASKVRCDKTKPVCSRCERLGYPCFYSPAIRVRKPKYVQAGRSEQEPAAQNRGQSSRPSSQSRRNRSETSSSVVSSASAVGPELSWDTSPARSANDINYDDLFSFTIPVPQYGRGHPHRVEGDLSHSGPTSGSEYSPDSIDVEMIDAVRSVNALSSASADRPHLFFDSPSSATSIPFDTVAPHQVVDGFDTVVQPSADADSDCATEAMSVLQHLNSTIMRHSSTTPGGSAMPGPSGDTCLYAVSLAVKRVSTILICPCSRRIDVGLLAATVCVALLDTLDLARPVAGNPAASSDATLMRILEELPRIANLAAQFTQRYKADGDSAARELLQGLAASITWRLRRMVDEVTNLVARVG